MKKITFLLTFLLVAFMSYGQILSTGFEDGLPPGWIVTSNGVGSGSSWVVSTAAGAPNTGVSALIVGPEQASSSNRIERWVITPMINLNGIVNPILSFYGRATVAGPNRNSRLEIRVSTTNTNRASFTQTLSSFQDYYSGASNPINASNGGYAGHEVSLLPFAGRNIYVAFVMVNEGVGKTWFLDDIEINEDCPPPTSLGVTNVSTTTTRATWLNPGNAPTFQLEVILDTDVPTGVPTYQVTTTRTSHEMINLIPNTAYKYYIRSVCGSNDTGDWVGPFTFETAPLPATLPYLESFEGAHGWRHLNGNQPNKWFVGSSTNNGGTKSLYISNNNGLSNEYTITANSVTQTYRDVVIPTGVNEIAFSFDFKGQGQTTLDYMKFWSVPNSFLPTAGTQLTTTGSGGVVIDALINQTPVFANKSYIINVSAYAGTTRRFVFEWINNNSIGTQTPAAVDNVKVEIITCSAPSNLRLTGVTTNTATVAWNASMSNPSSYDYYISQVNTSPTDATLPSGTSNTNSVTINGLIPGSTYFVWVRANCGPVNGKSFWIGYQMIQTQQIPVSLPYSENFESSAPIFQFSNDNQTNYWMIGTGAHNGGVRGMYVTNDAQTNQYTITSGSVTAAFKDFSIPAGTNEIDLQFDFRGVGEGTLDRMRIWLVPTTFIPTPGTQITTVSSGGSQIGLVNYSELIDWTSFNYVVNVSAFAGQNRRIVFEWVNNATSGTQTPAAIDNLKIKVTTCSLPTSVVLNRITASEAVLSWTPPATTSVNSYDYFLTTANTPPTSTTVPTGSVTETTVTISGLNQTTQYYFWVRSNCGSTNGVSYWVGPFLLTTKQIPAEIDFFDGFEGVSNFTLNNDINLINKWVIGSAISAVGDKSLYISNDNGVSHSYTLNTNRTVVHAFRDINIPAGTLGNLAFAYDWRNQGERNFDFMRVWVVPVDYEPVIGTQITSGANRRQLGGNHQMQNRWEYETFIVPASTYAGQTIRLVFEWTNNTSSGAQSPAAIDNVQVKIIDCSAPIDLIAEKGINNIINLSWTPLGGETQWELVIQPQNSGSPGNAPTTSVIVNNPFYSFTGLDGQYYEFFVRAICPGGGTSLWGGPQKFSILNPPACADLDIAPLNLDINTDGKYVVCKGEPFNIDLDANFVEEMFKDTSTYLVESIDYNPPFPFSGGIEMNVEIDDTYAPPFTLPFNICFYGNVFNSVQVSSNGYITFGTNYCQTAGCSTWSMSGLRAFPDATFSNQLRNVIMGVFQDIDPVPSKSPNASINYQVLGTYPCRALVVNFSDIALYGTQCAGVLPNQNSQIVIYEITNIIEVYVSNREACLSHNDGKGAIGLINSTGTQATIPPGRNVGTWTTQNEAWRFKPNGASSTTFGWYMNGQLVSENPQHTVTISETTKLEAVVKYPGCGGEELVLRKSFDILVTDEIILPQSEEVIICTDNLDEPGRGRITDNNDVILSRLPNPSKFKILYYESESDALSDTSAIVDPFNYLPNSYPKIIYARVQNIDTACFEITSFNVREGEKTNLNFVDVEICTNYDLPLLSSDLRYVKYEVFDSQNATMPIKTIENPKAKDLLPMGFYKIYLEATSKDGCTKVYTYKVVVISCVIPKGISPNGDGLNDYLDLTYYNAQQVKIFNRYGKEVYSHGPGYTNQWYGQSTKGDLLPSGTYFYNIVTPYENFTGWIQVTREIN